MSGSERKSWNEDFKKWTEEHPKETDNLRKIMGAKSVRDYQMARISNLDKLSPYRRAILYKVTGLESFNFAGYTDPSTISVKEILSGRQPRSALPIWLGKHELSKENLAEHARVDARTVYNFIQQRPIRGGGDDKIIKTLQGYIKKYEAVQEQASPSNDLGESPLEAAQPDVNLSGSINLDDVARGISELNLKMASLGKTYIPSPNDRERIVEAAIDLLVEQMDYFKQAPQSERAALVRHLEETNQLDRWGYVANLLNKINSSSGPDTFMRNYPAPPKGRE